MQSVLSNMMKELDNILKDYEYCLMEKSHIKQVVNYGIFLSKKENADVNIVIPATVFHDIGRYTGNIHHHTEIDYKLLLSILKNFSYTKSQITSIYECIRRHSIHSREKPSTIEQKVVFDADNLTLITPYGTVRWFFMAKEWVGITKIEDAIKNLGTIFERINRGEFFYTITAKEIVKNNSFYRDYIRSLLLEIR